MTKHSLFIFSSRAKTIKRILYGLLFILVLHLVFRLLDFILMDDWKGNGYAVTRLSMHEFYECKGEIDTLFLGSSHMQRAIDPQVVDAESGWSSYNLGQPWEPMDECYYLLKEAMKYNDIKNVYVDLYWPVTNQIYSDRGSDTLSFWYMLDYMRPSLNKLAFTFDASTKDNIAYTLFPARRKMNSIVDFKYISSNIRNKLTYTYRNYEGIVSKTDEYGGRGYLSSSVELSPNEGFELRNTTFNGSCGSISEDTEEYMKRIIGMCEDRGINLVFITTPMTGVYLSNVQGYPLYSERIEGIIKGTQASYIDFNQVEIGLEITDFSDYGHLNGKGATKFSRFLVEYISNS